MGATASTGFPTTASAFDTTHNGSGISDAFVTRLSPSGASLVYSTFLGAAGFDCARALAIDEQGAATVAGTASANFPTTPGALDTTYNGGRPVFGGDAFVARLTPDGSSLLYSTFLGGTKNEGAFALALDAQGAATVAGQTGSARFPTTAGAFDTTYNGGNSDAFVTRLDMLPTGVSAFGRSSRGCTGPLAISVTSVPRIGNAAFALTCGNAPPNATGGLALGARGRSSPLVVLGAGIWIDPNSPWFLVALTRSNAIGASIFALPLPNNPWLVGQKLNAQFVWIGPISPPPCPPLGVSVSNALSITIQR